MTAAVAERAPLAGTAALITRAQAVLHRAADIPMAEEDSKVTGALTELAAAMRFYHRIASSAVAPGDAYSMCGSQPETEWLPLALRMAAEEAIDEADEVIKVISEVLGDGIAATVRGSEGGE